MLLWCGSRPLDSNSLRSVESPDITSVFVKRFLFSRLFGAPKSGRRCCTTRKAWTLTRWHSPAKVTVEAPRGNGPQACPVDLAGLGTAPLLFLAGATLTRLVSDQIRRRCYEEILGTEIPRCLRCILSEANPVCWRCTGGCFTPKTPIPCQFPGFPHQLNRRASQCPAWKIL